ncbi:TPA: phage tail protein, partial [Pseudomonas aeruginosa]|nr:phage tail protein [Pseudomonas aeruginosa]HCF1421937.1 phage tail protein [Pseudomonas aeruginosa]
HKGYRSFLWTPPGGELGLYTCKAYRKQRRPGSIEVLSLTFDQAFHP